jgi:hypothetical protein
VPIKPIQQSLVKPVLIDGIVVLAETSQNLARLDAAERALLPAI